MAAAAGPQVVHASVLGKDGATAPSERIAMGFVGLGGQGSGHLFGGAWTYVDGGYLGRSDVQVVGVCDVWRQKREPAKDRVNAHYANKLGTGSYAGCKAHRDFRELLARKDVDGVLMALPMHWHSLMATMAVKAGKDVYCEKPIALAIRDSRALADAVRRYGRIYQAGTQQRSEYGGKFRRACELVRNGRIGKLQEVYAYRPGGGFSASGWGSSSGDPVPDGLDWDLWLGPAPWRPFRNDTGTNAFLFGFGGINWGPHHYDIVQWAVGADRSGPVEIEPVGADVAYRYANGVVVHGHGYPGEPVGAEGGLCLVGTEGRIAVDRSSIVSYPAEILREPLLPDDEHLYTCTSHAGNFVECMRTRKRTICDAETAHRSVSALLLGGIAMTLKRRVNWDPVNEEFPGDDEANRLLSVAKRAPWRV